MKKTGIIAILLIASKVLCAQNYQINVAHFSGEFTGGISVFSSNQFIGKTDSLGRISFKNAENVRNFRLVREGINYHYEFQDSQTGMFDGNQVMMYKFMIIPEPVERAIVRATRAGEREPFAKTNISSREIEIQNTARDLPVLLQFQPSVTMTSDAGNGVGYTGIRVRGSDAGRTNITINGVPINDAESQGTFWVNMPDLASSVKSIQLQRGVGSSTNGSGAFGATINIETGTSLMPYCILNNSAGSFGTYKSTIGGGTGLLNKHWVLDFRLSQIVSNGYIDRASSNLKSSFLSGGYIEKTWSLKFLFLSGEEKTYQAWYGIPREKMYGDDSALQAHYFRNQGFVYFTKDDSLNLFNSNKRTYNYYQYKNETDNYRQRHYHLYFTKKTGKYSNLNLTLYQTRGEGYFEQFRVSDSLWKYQLPNTVIGGDTISTSDLIRQRWLKNTLTGINANWLYSKNKVEFIAGGGYSQYFGDHFGEIIWARFAPVVEHRGNYYSAIGDKFDGNIFIKTGYNLSKDFKLTGELQLRRVYYAGRGIDNDNRLIRFKENYLFFNPKFGIYRSFGKYGSSYGSVSVGNREPSRSDFTDNPRNQAPKHESLTDFELGHQIQNKRMTTGVNLFYMTYKNQLVPTGAVNDVGTPLRSNVTNSYRMGLELIGEYKLYSWMLLNYNATLSDNRIKTLISPLVDYADGSIVRDTFNNTNIAYSPALISSLMTTFLLPGNWTITWNHKFVGRQYLDNTGDRDKSIEPYYVSEIWINKSRKFRGFELEFTFQVLNLWNTMYNNNGYAFDYYYGKNNLTREVYYFPSAPRNFMSGINLKF